MKRKKPRKYKKRRVLGIIRVWEKRFLVILLLLGVFGGAYYLVYRTEILDIKSFEILGTETYVNSADLGVFLYSNYAGKKLPTVNSSELETLLEDRFLGARDICVKKIWPAKLKILVSERKPLARLSNERYSLDHMIDEEGYVLGVVDPDTEDLPLIRYLGDLKVGAFVDPTLVPVYLDLIDALETSEIQVSSISFSPKDVTFYTREGTRILLGNSGDKQYLLTVLVKLLNKLSLEGKDASTIDLRYDKVVVSY